MTRARSHARAAVAKRARSDPLRASNYPGARADDESRSTWLRCAIRVRNGGISREKFATDLSATGINELGPATRIRTHRSAWTEPSLGFASGSRAVSCSG